MPDKRSHRGPHPEDIESFGPNAIGPLTTAVSDLSWLLTRGYSRKAAIQLVGDRLALTERQRLGVQRAACSDEELASRRSRELTDAQVAGRAIWIDGLNVLTTVEAALAGGIVLIGRDGSCRDMASIHGHYKRVEETRPAIECIGRTLARLGVSESVWFLDRPVSNSGRLRQWLAETAAARGWHWHTHLVPDPDTVLIRTAEIVASADSMVLDRCARWFNLTRRTIEDNAPRASVVNFSNT